jgi:magnesium transporter
MTTVAAFHFEDKRIETPGPDGIAAAITAGAYCWIDIESPADAPDVLGPLEVDPVALKRVQRSTPFGDFVLGRHCIHCALIETLFTGEELKLNTVHVVLGEGFIATIHAEPSGLLDQMRASYEEDFYGAARSGGFLLFEIADHLISGYRSALSGLSGAVDDIQRKLLGDVGDEILTEVSELTRGLLDYRNAVVGARETIYELATRRSPFVNESTQPFLDRQTLALERLASDAATERTVLSETLNLYMGIVSHRTNKVVNRLTVVSMVFLPLNFLAAVYGMNFDVMPELRWSGGYYAFWAFSSLLAMVLLLLMWWRKWL